MSASTSVSVSSTPEAFDCKGGSTRFIMLALSESHMPKEAMIRSKIADLNNHLSSPIEATINDSMAFLESIQKKFNEIGTTAIRANSDTFAAEAQKRLAESAVIGARLKDLLLEVDRIHASFTKIVPHFSVQPPSAESIATYTTLENTIVSVNKKLEQLQKEQKDLVERLETTKKTGINLLPDTHRNTFIRRLEQPTLGS